MSEQKLMNLSKIERILYQLEDEFKDNKDETEALKIIKDVFQRIVDMNPTIDPETLPIVRELRAQLAECKPVVHAHWETVPNRVLEHGEVAIRGTAQWCSACKHADKDFKKWMPFCPHCGAIMDEEIQ